MVQYSHINGRKYYGTSSTQQRHNDTGSASSNTKAIQNSQESLRALAKRYCINQKTVAKWKKRTSADDLTPYEFICKQWTDEPEPFKFDPIHQMPGLKT